MNTYGYLMSLAVSPRVLHAGVLVVQVHETALQQHGIQTRHTRQPYLLTFCCSCCQGCCIHTRLSQMSATKIEGALTETLSMWMKGDSTLMAAARATAGEAACAAALALLCSTCLTQLPDVMLDWNESPMHMHAMPVSHVRRSRSIW